MIDDEKGEGEIQVILGIFVSLILIWVFSQVLYQIGIGYAILFVILAVSAIGLSILKR